MLVLAMEFSRDERAESDAKRRGSALEARSSRSLKTE
jgi:hypothetical protein